MKKYMHYKILADHDILYIVGLGIISLEDIKKIMKESSSNPEYSSSYNVIVDFRYCILNLDHNSATEYLNYTQNELKIENNRKIGFLTSTPNQVVLTKLFSLELKDSVMQSTMFSTLEAVLNYTMNGKSKAKLLKQSLIDYANEIVQEYL